MFMLLAIRVGHSLLRRVGKTALMEWLIRKEGPIMERRVQPAARMESS